MWDYRVRFYFPGRLAALIVASIPVLALADDLPTASAPTFQVGDSWVFDTSHQKGTTGFSQQKIDVVIDRVSSEDMLVGVKQDGSPKAFEDHITGLDWSLKLTVNNNQTVTARPFSFPLKVGESWTADWTDPRRQGNQTSAHFHKVYKVVGWQDVTVPAGAFHAIKIEAKGSADANEEIPASGASAVVGAPGSSTAISHVQAARKGVIHMTTYAEIYYVPEIKYLVKSLQEQYNASSVMVSRDTEELVSYKVAH